MSKVERTLVLIPSSRYVDPEMRFEVGRIPPVLIPICGGTVLDLLVEQYSPVLEDGEMVIIAHEGTERIIQYIDQKYCDKNLSVATIPKVDDLGEAIVTALTTLDLSEFDRLILNFGDTLLREQTVAHSNAIFYSDLQESYRWTSFESDRGKLTGITDRFVSEDLEFNHVFCGVFSADNPGRFFNCLRDARSDGKISRFYVGIKNYFSDQSYELVKSESWLDFGHVDNYYQAKKKLVMRRFFNEVLIDERHSTVRKTSLNADKLSDEIRWYLELPSDLKKFLPQIFDHGLTGPAPFIEMEYYGYPTLSELFIAGGHNLGIWNHVFEGIFALLREMRMYGCDGESALQTAAMHEMYVNKTRDRIEQLRNDRSIGAWLSAPTVINGVAHPPLEEALQKLEEIVNFAIVSAAPSFTVIHGDFCLSNLLFDPRGRIIKMIDPRGRFGSYSIRGDPRYDLAKLSHSFNGSYDHIISGRFFALVTGNEIQYRIHLEQQQQQITALFNSWMKKVFPTEVRAVAAIEALLFLSMIPLHRDRLDRQIAMYAIAREKLDELIGRSVQQISVTDSASAQRIDHSDCN